VRLEVGQRERKLFELCSKRLLGYLEPAAVDEDTKPRLIWIVGVLNIDALVPCRSTVADVAVATHLHIRSIDGALHAYILVDRGTLRRSPGVSEFPAWRAADRETAPCSCRASGLVPQQFLGCT
jgi:hypothetical protein